MDYTYRPVRLSLAQEVTRGDYVTLCGDKEFYLVTQNTPTAFESSRLLGINPDNGKRVSLYITLGAKIRVYERVELP